MRTIKAVVLVGFAVLLLTTGAALHAKNADSSTCVQDLEQIMQIGTGSLIAHKYHGYYPQTPEGIMIEAYFSDKDLRFLKSVIVTSLRVSTIKYYVASSNNFVVQHSRWNLSGHFTHSDTEVESKEQYEFFVCDGEKVDSHQNGYEAPYELDFYQNELREYHGVSIATSKFEDIAHHNSLPAIGYLILNNIISGYPDGTYRPDNTINRAEFTKIVVGAAYPEDTVTGADCFPDIQNQWFAPYICSAKEKSIISGYPDGTFKPADSVNVAEAAKIVADAFFLELEGYPNDQWYEPYVRALNDLDALPESATPLDKPLTRGEMAEIVHRVMQQQ